MLTKPFYWLAVLVVVSAVLLVGQESQTRRAPQFENEHVKVWKSIILPDQPLRMHRHEHARALIALTDATLDIVQDSGKTETVHWEAGKAYWWCACGRSANQPFCDGSHKGTGFSPVEFSSPKARTIYFCGCKQTGNRPLCDGTHGTL